MKIDLHLHTKKIAKGEPKTRNIDCENFKENLKEANVKIVAITNHYTFDKKQYEKFKDDSYILLPGVELDVFFKGERIQANIIANPNDIDKFVEILKNIDNKKNPIEYNEFIKKFNLKK
jgi:predicted metal-dependent phosphoesterase TrpH